MEGTANKRQSQADGGVNPVNSKPLKKPLLISLNGSRYQHLTKSKFLLSLGLDKERGQI